MIQEDQGYTVSDWEPITPKTIDWQQDFAAAKKTAAGGHKNVLVLFDASDSQDRRAACSRFRESVAMRKEFRERADKQYVCVYIDNPRTAEAQERVRDLDRNARLIKEFGVAVFPTVIVTDPKGRVFGILEDYKIGGVNAFLEFMDKWETDGKGLAEMLARLDSSSGGGEGSELAGQVLDFLELNKLDRFYSAKVKDLQARVGASGGRQVTREAYENWMRRFDLASRNADEAKGVVETFDRWKRSRAFKDPEMGAKLHLAAAWLLAQVDLRKEAVEKCKEGLAFEPRDARVRALLTMFNQALGGEPGKAAEIAVGSGTGFCVAQGNYVLTNHHVVRGAKKIKVRLCHDKTTYPATLVADNEDGDMALLKLELPADKTLRPVPLVAQAIRAGQGVCALGFPEIGSNSTTPTVTQGIASSVPDSDNDAGMIVTDCRVNPGNSGGPLCSFNGSIAGMVTAKSHISVQTDSFGLVIPAARLKKFLAENLPADSAKMPREPTGAATLQLADLNDLVSPSVVHVENIQEMRAMAGAE